MTRVYKQCQSCGMPMKMDKKGGGTEKNDKISTMYCSSCYENGKFKKPNMTVKEMQKLVDKVLKKEMGRRRIFRRLAIRQIPGLQRWKKKK